MTIIYLPTPAHLSLPTAESLWHHVPCSQPPLQRWAIPATSWGCTSRKGGSGKIERKNNRSNTSRAVPGTEQRRSTKAEGSWLSHQAHRPEPGSWLQAPSCCPANPTSKREMGKRSQPTGTDRAERTGMHLPRGSTAAPSVPRLSSSPETETTCPRLPVHPSSAGAARGRAGRGGSAHRHGPRGRPHRGPGNQRRPRRDSETAPPRPRGPEGTAEVTSPLPPGQGSAGMGSRVGATARPARMRAGFLLHPGGHGLPAPLPGRVPRAGTRRRDPAPCRCLTAGESLPACSPAADAAGGAGTLGSASRPLPVVAVAAHLPRRPRRRPGRAAPPDPQPSPPRAPQASAATGGRP